MTFRGVTCQLGVAAAAVAVLDLIWLGLVAGDLYRRQLGDLLADDLNALAAVAFYLVFVCGFVLFVTAPAVREGSWRAALARGAAFGLVTYATWDLTNLAVLEGFPVTIAVIDLIWGTLLSATAGLVTYAVCRRLSASQRLSAPAPP